MGMRSGPADLPFWGPKAAVFKEGWARRSSSAPAAGSTNRRLAPSQRPRGGVLAVRWLLQECPRPPNLPVLTCWRVWRTARSRTREKMESEDSLCEHSIGSWTGTGARAALLHPEHVLVIWGRHIECQLGSRLQLRHGPWVAPLFDFGMSICE